MFLGYFRTFDFSSLGGIERIWTHHEEGAKFWKGGQKFWILIKKMI